MRDDAVERLFSLFTSSECAVAMAGDLAEERARRGWLWFWLHAVRVTLALWRSAVTEAPLGVLGLTLAGVALLSAPAFAGLASVYLVPRLNPAVSWMSVSFFWCGGALWTGAWLVTVAPRPGMASCAILGVAGLALLLALGASEPEPFSRADRMFFTVALGSAVALLAGGAFARRRTTVAFTTPVGEQ